MSSLSPPGRGSPGRPGSEGGYSDMDSTFGRSSGNLLKVPKQTGQRLPREGASPGGGKVSILNRGSFEATVRGFSPEDEQPPAGLSGSTRRNSTRHASGGSPERGGESATGSTGKGDRKSPGKDNPGYASSSAGTSSHASEYLDREKDKNQKRNLTQAERKRIEIGLKWAKVDAQREKHQQWISEKVEKGKAMRDERFKRMLDEVTGCGGLAFNTAMQLREMEAREDRKVRDLYNSWNEKVFQPIAAQAFEHLNPPDRAEQQALTGTKSVSFNVPGRTFRLQSDVREDPVRKPLLDAASENAFHVAANSFLRGSASAPELRHPAVLRVSGNGQSGSTPVLPRATTRPVLEPMEWGQVQLQGSMCGGKFSQNCEYGVGFRRMKRGESGVFVPDEADGVVSSGKRSVRDQNSSTVILHGDVGILAGDIASRGESTRHKYADGGSSGAPAQDHYMYRTGTQVTDIEFPLGKKMFKQFH